MSNEKGTLSIEEQGIDTISEEERKGTPASLFWLGSLPMFPCSPCRTARGRLVSAFRSGRLPP